MVSMVCPDSCHLPISWVIEPDSLRSLMATVLLVAGLPLALACTFAVAALDIVFIATSVTPNAIIEIANAFVDMLATDVCQRVLVATVTGVAAVVVAQMTGHTTCVVVAIENKILVVVEACRRPSFLAVTLTTVAGNLLVQGVGRGLVTTLALQERVLLQQGMI